ncbi:unnamed protein product, partial [Prorocentrum cordatum]
RIRECDDNGLGEPYAIVQFTSKGECEKAFNEKQGGKMSTHRVVLSGCSESEFKAIERIVEPPPGTYAYEKKTITTLTDAAAESHESRPGASAAWDVAWKQASKPKPEQEQRTPASWVINGPPKQQPEEEPKAWQPSYLVSQDPRRPSPLRRASSRPPSRRAMAGATTETTSPTASKAAAHPATTTAARLRAGTAATTATTGTGTGTATATGSDGRRRAAHDAAKSPGT